MPPTHSIRDLQPTLFINDSGESVPAFGVLRVTETDPSNRQALLADKPDGTNEDCTFWVNLDKARPDGQTGFCTRSEGCYALFDDTDTPVPGEEWGPDDDWMLHKGKGGFIIVGGIIGSGATARVRVNPRGGGGGRIEGAIAIIKGTVPKSSGIDVTGTLTESSEVGDYGLLAVSATEDTFTAGALLVHPQNGKYLPIFRNGALRAVDVLNPAYTDFIGEGDGVAVCGTLLRWTEIVSEEEVEKEAFLLPWPDFRAMPGYAIGTEPTGDDDEDLQIIYHSGGEDHFKLDSEDCAAEAE